MSAQPQEINHPSISKNQILIAGRVKEVRRVDSGTFTSVVLPAPDEFSMPQTVEIMSTGMIGRPNEDIQIKCTIGGYSKKFKRKDGTDGHNITNVLRVVE